MAGRGFEIVTAYEGCDIHLPVRKTAKSAGYDLEAAETTVLAPHAVTVVPTGLKAFMETMNIYLSSSAPAWLSRKASCWLTARASSTAITTTMPTMKGTS